MIINEHDFPPGYSYSNRAEKAAVVAKLFCFALHEPLLNVGCDRKNMKHYLPEGFDYTGLDAGPEADVRINLDREPIPFENGSFSTVVCTDVLEHLDSFHHVFNRLVDLSSHYVVLSLPN